jgi:hypothetical protein
MPISPAATVPAQCALTLLQQPPHQPKIDQEHSRSARSAPCCCTMPRLQARACVACTACQQAWQRCCNSNHALLQPTDYTYLKYGPSRSTTTDTGVEPVPAISAAASGGRGPHPACALVRGKPNPPGCPSYLAEADNTRALHAYIAACA